MRHFKGFPPAFALIALLALLSLVLTGCPKKPPVTGATPQPTQTPEVTTQFPGTQGGSGGMGTLGPGGGTSGQTPTQIASGTTGEGGSGLTPGATPTPVRIPTGSVAIAESELKTVYFEYDRSRITGEAQQVLSANGRWIQDHPDAKILIEGNCDERGTNEYNLALGERRAFAAKNFLVNLGIAPGRLYTLSYGEERPADPGHTEDAWAKNRRVEFKILGPGEMPVAQ